MLYTSAALLKVTVLIIMCYMSVYIKKGVSFPHGKVSIITYSDLSDVHVISMNVTLPARRREG